MNIFVLSPALFSCVWFMFLFSRVCLFSLWSLTFGVCDVCGCVCLSACVCVQDELRQALEASSHVGQVVVTVHTDVNQTRYIYPDSPVEDGQSSSSSEQEDSHSNTSSENDADSQSKGFIRKGWKR